MSPHRSPKAARAVAFCVPAVIHTRRGALSIVKLAGIRHRVAHVDTTVLLELHDHLVPGVSDRVRARFAATHAIRQIDEAGAIPPQFVAGLNDEEQHYLREGRVVRQSWLVMEPRDATLAA